MLCAGKDVGGREGVEAGQRPSFSLPGHLGSSLSLPAYPLLSQRRRLDQTGAPILGKALTPLGTGASPDLRIRLGAGQLRIVFLPRAQGSGMWGPGSGKQLIKCPLM